MVGPYADHMARLVGCGQYRFGDQVESITLTDGMHVGENDGIEY